MLDLSDLPCTATMRLTKATPRREGAGLSWDLELVQEIPDQHSAQVVDTYLPGAVAVWEAREGAKGSTSTSGGFDILRATFQGPDGTQLATGHGEIRGATVRVNASQAVLLVKLRIHGLLQESAMAVVYSLDEPLQVSLRANATQLSLLPQVTPRVSLEGRLVVHRTPDGVVAGVVTRHEGAQVEVATLEQPDTVQINLPPGSSPDTSVEIGTRDGDSLRDLLVDYVGECDRLGVRSSWQDVVTALGRLYASHTVEPAPDQSWEITQQVLDEALQVAREVTP